MVAVEVVLPSTLRTRPLSQPISGIPKRPRPPTRLAAAALERSNRSTDPAQHRFGVPTDGFAKAARRAVHETTILRAQGTRVGIADVVLMKSGPHDVGGAVELSHATLCKMHQMATLAMSGSSALVAINALILKRTELAGITQRSSHQTSQLRPADFMA